MKHTFATMLLTALLCAIAAPGMAQGEQPYVSYGNTDGGTVKFYGADPTSNPAPEEIAQAEPGTTVYLVPVPDDFHTTEGLQLKAVKTADSNVAEIPRRGVGYAQDIEIVTDVAGSLYHFTMPAGGADVWVSATFGKRTQKVIYLDPTKPADQQECEVEAYILDKPVSELPGSGEEGTWYVCTTRATENEGKGLVIEGPLKLFSKVNLILADGCKMTVSAENDYAIDGATSADGELTIYAQSTGSDMGQLEATSSVNPEPTDGPNPSNHGNYAICLYNLTINGGAITATGPLRGIFCNVISSNTVLSINGGRVSAKGTGDGSYGIESADKMSITGGQVTATGQASGINVPTGGLDITLSSADDFVEASGYYLGGVSERPAASPSAPSSRRPSPASASPSPAKAWNMLTPTASCRTSRPTSISTAMAQKSPTRTMTLRMSSQARSRRSALTARPRGTSATAKLLTRRKSIFWATCA